LRAIWSFRHHSSRLVVPCDGVPKKLKMLLGRPNLLTSVRNSNHALDQANHDFASEIKPNSSIDPAGFLAPHRKSSLQKPSIYWVFHVL
jgi:hypothetical protein